MIRGFVVIICVILISSCNKKSISWMSDNNKIKILSMTEMIDDVVREIGRDKIDTITLIDKDLNPHNYEIVKGDIEKFERADIIFYHGLGLETGAALTSLLHREEFSSHNETQRVENINKNPFEVGCCNKHKINVDQKILENLSGNVHGKAFGVANFIERHFNGRLIVSKGETDPHIWMDLSLWKEIVPFIVQILKEKDPSNGSFYEKNGRLLMQKMQRSHDDIKKLLQKIPSEKRFLITAQDSFGYFAKAYLAEAGENWLERIAAPTGSSHDGQISNKDMMDIFSKMKKNNIKVLFSEAYSNDESLQKIIWVGKQKSIDIKIAKDFLHGDSLGAFEGDCRYIKMMEHNAHTIVKYLDVKD